MILSTYGLGRWAFGPEAGSIRAIDELLSVHICSRFLIPDVQSAFG
jgi:hypothetical protein